MSDPHNPHEYDAAKRAADGDLVERIQAAKVKPEMVLFHKGRFLVVQFANQMDRSVLINYYPDQGAAACRVVAPAVKLYRRVPTQHPVCAGTAE